MCTVLRLLMTDSRSVRNIQSTVSKLIWEIVHLVGFYYNNISRCTVVWMSSSYFDKNKYFDQLSKYGTLLKICNTCNVPSIGRISTKRPCIDILARFCVLRKTKKRNQIIDSNTIDHNKNFDVRIEPAISRAHNKSPIARTATVHVSLHNYIFA